jgi:predicted MFS family arabinose efflux permease
MPERLRWSVRWRLSTLWLLQWAITGAIFTYLPLYFAEKGVGRNELGELMAIGAVGLWLAPFLVGQICDRWLGAEKYLAASHFLGGLALLAIPIATDYYSETRDYRPLAGLVGFYAIAYFPTVPVASALTFRHLPSPKTQFGRVRMWGTVGWVLAGLFLSLWLGHDEAIAWVSDRYPESKQPLARFGHVLEWLGTPASDDCFRIAALLSFALSSFCAFLPQSPPVVRSNGIAPFQVLKMFGDRTFAVMIAASFALALVVPLYSLETPKLLEQSGVDPHWVPAVMTIGQISEFPALLLLALCLKVLGMRRTFLFGMTAWLARYLVFAITTELPAVIAAIAMHGICHVFLIIVIQLYVDAACRPDLRASAQNMFAFVTMGIGMPIGFLLGGQLARWSEDPTTHTASYPLLFSVPAAVILLVMLAFSRSAGLWPTGERAEPAPEPRRRVRAGRAAS